VLKINFTIRISKKTFITFNSDFKTMSDPSSPRRGDNTESYNPLPQHAPGSAAAVGHHVENSIPLSIFPISLDKLCICFCGLPGRGKTEISRKIARQVYNSARCSS
jgi:hypothetical protein